MFRIMEKFVIFEIFWINFEIDENKSNLKIELNLDYLILFGEKILYV